MSGILPVVRPVQADTPTVHLTGLHAELRDTIRGYEAALESGAADDDAVMREFLELHRRHHPELDRIMAAHGLEPKESGGASAGAADLSGEGRALPRIIERERRLSEAYGQRLSEGNPDDVIEVLERQQDELTALIDRHEASRGA